MDTGWTMPLIMFDQVLAKGGIQVSKITSDNMPEGICSDHGRLYVVKSE